MANKNMKSTGLGADAFFAIPTSSKTKTAQGVAPEPRAELESRLTPADEKAERRSFNLRLSILRQLDEVQIKTMREANKWTLSAIVERGIELVAQEMGVSEEINKRVKESKHK